MVFGQEVLTLEGTMNWYLKVLRQYADFRGRARRTEYWTFFLFNVLFALLAIFVDYMLGTADEETGYGILYALYSIFTFVPSLALFVRRLHDVGKSGWFALIILLPFVGAIWLFVLLLTEGEATANKWGPNPKAQW